MDDEMDELLAEFLVESFENLDQLDQDLISLEQDPHDREVLKSIFRTVHTIKGTCGFLALHKLEAIAHVGENLLSLLRDGEASVDTRTASALLALSDCLRAIMHNLQESQHEGENDYSELIDELKDLEARATATDDAAASSDAHAAVAQPVSQAAELEPVDPELRLGEVLVHSGIVSEVDVTIGLIRQSEGDERPIGEILVEAGAVNRDDLRTAVASQKGAKATGNDSTLRIDVAVLDDLMTLVGELVLARNQLVQLSGSDDNPALNVTTQRLNAITSELQNGVMKTRMQPIGTVWSKFPRVARDVATACGKQVRVEMEGKEIELDKTIIEAIKDPLTHVIRNSIDHGIEAPEDRRSIGKDAEGVVLLRAYHEGGQVIIEIVDDGAGINVDRVKAKAIEKELITDEQAAVMNDRDATNLVFLPGFSTADAVSNISGRGVGMDVVKTNIEKIGGAIDLSSTPGIGSTLRIRIPLTLAIIPALIVTCAGEQFVIPQVSLLELVGLDTARIEQRIETVHAAPVYRLRDKLLPLLSLREILAFDRDDDATQTIVVLKVDDCEFGLIVDKVNDSEEIVVKPLSKQIHDVRVFSGCTIMGDGRVALILDVAGVARSGGLTKEHFEDMSRADARHATDVHRDVIPALVTIVGEDQPVALPLSAVDRLEEFNSSLVERSMGYDVVQYRERMLPLIDLGSAIGESAVGGDVAQLQVVVCEVGNRLFGFVVKQVLDIVQEPFEQEATSVRFGVRSSAVINGRVTDLIDVFALTGIQGSEHAADLWADHSQTAGAYV